MGTPYHDLYVATGITCFVLVMDHAASGRLNSRQQRNESCISIIYCAINSYKITPRQVQDSIDGDTGKIRDYRLW